jgi:putative transposase
MSRLRRIATRDRVFFVTTNLLRTNASLSVEDRNALLDVLASRRENGAFWLFGYVIMPDHVHLLLRPHNVSLDDGMRAIKSISALRIMRHRGVRGRLWQPRYFDNIIRHAGELWKKLEYIHNNPVAAGLVAIATDWRWSSCGAFTPSGTPPIPIDKPFDFPADGAALLWPAP